MGTTHRMRAGISAGTLAIMATLATTGTASASNADISVEAADSVTIAAAPSCVRVRHTVGTITQTVYVKNNCRTTVSWRLESAGGTHPCKITRPGKEGKVKWARFVAFQGIKWNCA